MTTMERLAARMVLFLLLLLLILSKCVRVTVLISIRLSRVFLRAEDYGLRYMDYDAFLSISYEDYYIRI